MDQPETHASPVIAIVTDLTSTCSDHDASSGSDDINIPYQSRTTKGMQSYARSDPDDMSCSAVQVELESQDAESLLQSAVPSHFGHGDVGNEAMQLTRTCNYGSKLKAMTLAHEADLACECVDIDEACVEAVPLEQGFYNQWARAPREEDDSDPDAIFSSSRRPTSLRMLPAMVSLKSYTLLGAITRDRQHALQRYGHALPAPNTSLTSLQPECAAKDVSSTSLRLARGTPEIVSLHTRSTRPGVTGGLGVSKSEGLLCSVDNSTSATFPLIGDLTNIRDIARTDDAERYLSCDGDDSCLGVCLDGAERKSRRRIGERKTCDAERCGSRNCRGSTSGARQSASPQRHQQALSMNTASFLFSTDIDRRDQCYRHYPRSRPRLTLRSRQLKNEVGEGSAVQAGRRGKADKSQHGGDATAEMTRVEFIDLTEVKKILLKERNPGRAGDRRGVVAGPGCASLRRTGRQTVARGWDGQAPCGRLSHSARPFLAVGLPVSVVSPPCDKQTA